MNAALKALLLFYLAIRSIRYNPALEGHEKRKLGIFNLVNFVGLVGGVLIPVLIWTNVSYLPDVVGRLCSIPMCIRIIILILNYWHQYESARMSFFTLYPLFITCSYVLKIDVGAEFFYMVFGVTSFFFLSEVYNIIVSFSLSMICYFLAHTFWADYLFMLKTMNFSISLSLQVLAIFFVFIGLFLSVMKIASTSRKC